MIAALFVMPDSHYKSMPGVDAFDAERNALNFTGGCQVVAHPPCRSWSRMRHFAKPRPGERELAIFAIDMVRSCGGVLEHPSGSELWKVAGLPVPGSTAVDEYGGFTLPVSQKWWGHRAEKRTWLYIVGVSPTAIPPFPIVLGEAERVCGLWSGRDRSRARKEIGPNERMASPPLFAEWLVELASMCKVEHA
jgi:hypothetical protein